MRPTRRLLAAAVPALGALAAAPAAHAAPAIGPLKPCYVSVNPAEREQLRTFATGFTPHADVDVSVGAVTEPGLVDAFGGVNLLDTAAPYQEHGQAPFTVTVREVRNQAMFATATSMVTALSVRLRPKEAGTSERVRFRGRGFTADRPIWGHYVYRDEVRRTVRLVDRPDGPCGTFSVRRRQFPMAPRPGRWTLQVDQRHRWSPHPADSVYVPVTITVKRVARDD